ncbi:hypothetical protein Tco_0915551 [Tanacetum coccineum]
MARIKWVVELPFNVAMLYSASEGLETVLTKPATRKGASHIEQQIEEEFNTSPDLSSSDDAKKEIKLEDLSNLVQNVKADFMDLDLPEDEPIIVVDESEEEEEANKTKYIHATFHTETEDTSVPTPPSPRKLELEKNKAEAEVALLSTQLSFSNVAQLTELLVKSLTLELLKLLSCHGFSSSLPTELKELSSKFNKLSREVKDIKKHVQGLEIELPGELKEIPNKLETFTSIVSSLTSQVTELNTLQWELPKEFLVLPGQLSSVQAKLKTLDALASLLNKVNDALNNLLKLLKILEIRVFLQQAYPPKSSSQPEGEPIKKDKGKKAMSYKDIKEESTKSNSDADIINLAGFMVESSKKKKMRKFDFVTNGGKHVHLTEEQIKEQKRIEESVKADTTKQEVEASKEEWIDLLGVNVVTKYYKAKLQYDK